MTIFNAILICIKAILHSANLERSLRSISTILWIHGEKCLKRYQRQLRAMIKKKICQYNEMPISTNKKPIIRVHSLGCRYLPENR